MWDSWWCLHAWEGCQRCASCQVLCCRPNGCIVALAACSEPSPEDLLAALLLPFQLKTVLCTLSCSVMLQVLPPDVMLLAEPSPEDLLSAVEEAIQRVPQLDPLAQHDRVRLC